MHFIVSLDLSNALFLRLIKWDFMGRVAGILMLGYWYSYTLGCRYNSTKSTGIFSASRP